MSFTHLHVHTQYSILDGATRIKDMIAKAISDGMPAVAITDHGNMFGVKAFYDECKKQKFKGIIGSEAYVARRTRFDKSEVIDRSGEHLVILAKNITGYKNLTKLTSAAAVEGFYYRPRIDKELLEQYHEGLIIISACLGGEIDKKIAADNLEGARECARWYKRVFDEDYYLELQRHPAVDPKSRAEVYDVQEKCIKEKLKIAKELGIKVVATNDVHFLNSDDADAHDLLLCISTKKDYDDPNRMRYTRHEWFKTTEEMEALFTDIPEAISNTEEIVNKIEDYILDSDPIMPVFPIPEEFGTEEEYRKRITEEELFNEFTRDEKGNVVMSQEDAEKKIKKLGGYNKLYRIKLEADYLANLAMKGAKKRYGDPIPEDILERIVFELHIMKTMGFPGYFLIVQDFIAAARSMGVIVGPGRGSAAGSAVAYCLGITNIDPIKYDLLFERFLNPDRISLPDIDVDFDDEGRQKVLEWVTEKYGQDKVCHIVTFGSMAAKMAIKDCARVLKLEIAESNRLAKMVPDTPKITLKKAYEENPDLAKERESDNPLIRKTLDMAERLEGSIRQPGIHACGIIISRDPLTDHIPVIPTEGESLMTTQYDGHFVEPIGLIKMDFLGLSTLTIIKTCLKNIKISKGITVHEDEIPLNDPETMALFSRGETTGLFQFESPGMKKHLRALKPNRFEDLVAMNALYRPGPMDYIPQFINRKLGKEPIEYEHPMMEKYLKDTYGVTVYQEQVMLQSRLLGNFTRGQSDTLRKAMGKKIIKLMDELKEVFMQGCKNNPEFVDGCKLRNRTVEDMVNKIWGDWEAFAKYAFNKSHSVCYAYIAYQTGYLKTHYPAEFMAANLSNNKDKPDKLIAFMDECKRMRIKVMSPDVNESYNDFTVNSKGEIRFGLSGIKGVGEAAGDSIIAEREKGGPFKDVYDFFERVDSHTVNRKAIENMIAAGCFDSFGYHRAQFFGPTRKGNTVLDSLCAYGQSYQIDTNKIQVSLFADMNDIAIVKPEIPDCEHWKEYQQASKEKELIGQFLTSHPLNIYHIEMLMCEGLELMANGDMNELKNKEVCFGGIITAMREGKTKNGKDFAIITLTDYVTSAEFPLFGKDYTAFRNYIAEEAAIFVQGVFEHKWGNEKNPIEFRIKNIGALEELGQGKLKSITIQINAEEVTKELISELYKRVIKDNTVENTETFSNEKQEEPDESALEYLPLKVNIYDDQGNIVQLFSRKCMITKSKALFDFANEYNMFTVRIDK
ncbi:MAG: DNA polymerase III subunit alpha [Odoribacter sp.]|nr:DNA polymerase III subunit alpha [Odoribacter sp.]